MSRKSRIVSRKIFVASVYEQLVHNRTTGADLYKISLYDDVSLAMIHMLYLAEWFFTAGDKSKEDIGNMIDVEFLKGLISGRALHSQAVINTVNIHSQSFRFNDMDPIDQALFLEGGIEYLVHQTPLKILLNEMIEIAKRYGDEGSSKLINGIGHKVITDLSHHTSEDSLLKK